MGRSRRALVTLFEARSIAISEGIARAKSAEAAAAASSGKGST